MTITIRQLDRTGDTILAEIDYAAPAGEVDAAVAEANRIIAQARASGKLVYTQDSKQRGHIVTSMSDVVNQDVIVAPQPVGG